MNKINLDSNVTIGISAYGNIAATRNCISALFNSAQGNYELILVDDCSPDNGQIYELFQHVSTMHNNTIIFKFDSNLEYSGSLNCILSHATGDKIIFLSNDIYVTPDYLHEILSVSEKSPEIGIVRGVSNFVDNGKPTHNIAYDKQINLDDILGFSNQIRKSNSDSYFYEEYLTGDAFLINRRLLDKIGTFDPLFFGYFADTDLGVRAHIAGFKLAVAQGAFAFHHCNTNFNYLDDISKQTKVNARWAKVYENWARFKIKYNIPVNVLYTTLRNVDWSNLNKTNIDPFVAPGNYLSYKK